MLELVEERDGLPVVVEDYPDEDELTPDERLERRSEAQQLVELYHVIRAALVAVCVRRPKAPRVEWLVDDPESGDYFAQLTFTHGYLVHYELEAILRVARARGATVSIDGYGRNVRTTVYGVAS